ncbi:hypothetical protein HDU93_000214 [Gonapodya sp. JEL0774]|nr:hypothetical protein HDU93_000214 [Gonapodya sp. JEL0774]
MSMGSANDVAKSDAPRSSRVFSDEEPGSRQILYNPVAICFELLRNILTRPEGPSGVARVSRLLRHIDGIDDGVPVPTILRSSDGALALLPLDPFQSHEVHDLYGCVDPDVLSWDNLIDCLKSGQDRPFIGLLKKGAPYPDPVATESLFLLLIYLACYYRPDCDAQAVDGVWRDVVEGIVAGSFGIVRSSALPTNTWYSAFSSRTLQVPLYRSLGNPTQSIPSNVHLIRLLDSIRLQSLDSFLSKVERQYDAGNKLGTQDLSRLASVLSVAAGGVVEYGTLIQDVSLSSLLLLSRFASHVPVSWYTESFLESTLSFWKTDRSVIVSGETDIEASPLERARAVITMWTAWVRKVDFSSTQTSHFSTILHELLRITGTSDLLLPLASTLPSLVTALVSSTSLNDPSFNDLIPAAVASALRIARGPSKCSMNDLAGALAHLLVTIGPRGKRGVEEIVGGILGSFGPELQVKFEDGLRVGQILEYACQQWESEVMKGRNDKNGGKNRQTSNTRDFSGKTEDREEATEVEPGYEWCEGFIEAVEDAGKTSEGYELEARTVALFAIAGVLKHHNSFLKDNKIRQTKANTSRTQRLEQTFCHVLEDVLDVVEQIGGLSSHKEAVTYCYTQVHGILIYARSKIELPMRDVLLRTMTQVTFQSPSSLIPDRFFFQQLSLAASRLIVSLEADPSLSATFSTNPLHAYLTEREDNEKRPALLSIVPQTGKAIGGLMKEELGKGSASSVADSFEIIAESMLQLSTSWEDCPLSLSRNQKSPAFEQTSTILWSQFRPIIFVVVAIGRELVEALSLISSTRAFHNKEVLDVHSTSATSEERVSLKEPTFLHRMLRCANLLLRSLQQGHFITCRFGTEGFGMWRELFQDTVAFLLMKRREHIAGAITATAGDDLMERMAKDLIPKDQGIRADQNPVPKSRVLFLFTFVRQSLSYLTENVIDRDILVKAVPFLNVDPKAPERDPEDQDLFEAAHAVCTGIYENNQRYQNLITAFAPFYTSLLLREFPHPIDFDLLRRCFTSVIRGLSSASSFHYSASTFVAGNERVDNEERVESLGITGPTDREDGAKKQEDVLTTNQTIDTVTLDERDLTAWTCIMKLAHQILDLQLTIERAENAPRSLNEVEQDRQKDAAFLIEVITAARSGSIQSSADNKEGAWTRFLSMDPAQISRQRIERGQLAVLLFDQIRAVGLRTLDPLLCLIEGLMLDGRVPPELEEVEERKQDLNQAVDRGLLGYGLGLEVEQIESNPLWKSLFDAISTERNFDFTKKRRCIDFYLGLLKEAKIILADFSDTGEGRRKTILGFEKQALEAQAT